MTAFMSISLVTRGGKQQLSKAAESAEESSAFDIGFISEGSLANNFDMMPPRVNSLSFRRFYVLSASSFSSRTSIMTSAQSAFIYMIDCRRGRSSTPKGSLVSGRLLLACVKRKGVFLTFTLQTLFRSTQTAVKSTCQPLQTPTGSGKASVEYAPHRADGVPLKVFDNTGTLQIIESNDFREPLLTGI
ncbi:hypothetical protein Efla_002713 [Eimeria flavescens]